MNREVISEEQIHGNDKSKEYVYFTDFETVDSSIRVDVALLLGLENSGCQLHGDLRNMVSASWALLIGTIKYSLSGKCYCVTDVQPSYIETIVCSQDNSAEHSHKDVQQRGGQRNVTSVAAYGPVTRPPMSSDGDWTSPIALQFLINHLKFGPNRFYSIVVKFTKVCIKLKESFIISYKTLDFNLFAAFSWLSGLNLLCISRETESVCMQTAQKMQYFFPFRTLKSRLTLESRPLQIKMVRALKFLNKLNSLKHREGFEAYGSMIRSVSTQKSLKISGNCK